MNKTSISGTYTPLGCSLAFAYTAVKSGVLVKDILNSKLVI